MERTESYLSKKAIEYMLENYRDLGAIRKCFSDVLPDNPIKSDGVVGGQLDKIMLDQALRNIEDRNVKACAYARWVHAIPRKRTLAILRISTATYYRYGAKAIDLIYEEINGNGIKKLSELILQEE